MSATLPLGCTVHTVLILFVTCSGKIRDERLSFINITYIQYSIYRHIEHSGIYFVLVEFNCHKTRESNEIFESENDKKLDFVGIPQKNT